MNICTVVYAPNKDPGLNIFTYNTHPAYWGRRWYKWYPSISVSIHGLTYEDFK